MAQLLRATDDVAPPATGSYLLIQHRKAPGPRVWDILLVRRDAAGPALVQQELGEAASEQRAVDLAQRKAVELGLTTIHIV